jgi:hypothetical protein
MRGDFASGDPGSLVDMLPPPALLLSFVSVEGHAEIHALYFIGTTRQRG